MTSPSRAMQVLIDNVQDRNGSLYEDYEFLLPKMIKVSYSWASASNLPARSGPQAAV